MKYIQLFLLSALLFCANAFATGTTPPPPKPKPDPKPRVINVKSDADAKAVSGSKSSSTSGSKSSSDSTSAASVGDTSSNSSSGVGNIDASSGATGGSAAGGSVNDNSEFNARAWSLFVPPSVFTPPMPRPEVPQGCPAPTETQDALEVGKGVIFSKASSLRDNSPCVAIRYSQILWDRCQYQKADRILAIGMKKFAKEVGDDWDTQADPNITNYTLAECGVLKQNMVRVDPPPMLMIPPAEPKKEAPPKKAAAKPKKVPPCPAGEVLACKKVS